MQGGPVLAPERMDALDHFRCATVRIFGARGAVVGAGFLVSERHLLTCAHVVAQALGVADTGAEPPVGDVQLDFPLLGPGRSLPARVVAWRPVRSGSSVPSSSGDDIAVLELAADPPPGSRPARLVLADDPWGHPFRAFGFPAGYDGGVWASGVLRAGQSDGWVQIEDTKQTGFFVAPGFSGGPVWDETADGVIGMAVTADRRAEVKAAFIVPASTLVKAWPALAPQAIPPCPYRGLFAFREQDAPAFFGRDSFVEQLVAAVRTRPLVAVIGPSGSGKSSVIYAGLLPRLRPEGTSLIVSFRPGDRPLRALAVALVPLLEIGMSETDQLLEIAKLGDAFERGDLQLSDVADALLRKHPGADRLVVIADQFEELYTLCQDRDMRQRFLDQLLTAARGPSPTPAGLALVLTLRADFLGHALSYRPCADALQDADLKLGPMTRAELREVIEKPALQLGVSLEDGLTERILDALGDEPGDLPLLEFALTQLWERQDRGRLTHAGYDAIGGVERALTAYADEVFRQLDAEAQERARHVFMQLVRPGEGTVDTRRQAVRAEVGDRNWDLVARLATSRLVVSSRDDATKEETVEIVHEALITGWQRLRVWTERDRRFRVWQEQLRAARRQWEASGHDEGALLRGFLLAEAEQWHQERGPELGERELVFVLASQELARREADARQRDRAARERLWRRILVGLTTALGVTLAFALAAGLLWQQSELRGRLARSRALAASAVSQLAVDPELSVLLALEAIGQSSSTEAVDALRQGLLESHVRAELRGHTDHVLAVAYSPDRRHVATAAWDATARIWEVESGREVMVLKGHTKLIGGVAFSADGTRIATASLDGTARIWDASTGSQVGGPIEHRSGVNAVIFDPSGTRVVTAGVDRIARVSDARTGEPLLTLGEDQHRGQVNSATFSPDGSLILTSSDDRVARLWDATSGAMVGEFLGHTQPVVHAQFSPGGDAIVTASWDRTARIWDRATRASVTLTGHTERVKTAVFNRDGTLVVTASDDATARVWDADTGGLVHELRGHDDVVTGAAFSPDGLWILTASRDTTARIWDVKSGRAIAVLRGHRDYVSGAAWSPDGRMVVTGSADYTARLWEPGTGPAVAILGDDRGDHGHRGRVNGAVFNADSSLVVTAGADAKSIIWRVSDGTPMTELIGHGDDVRTAVFSPDGARILTSSVDGTARLWDASGGTEATVLQGHTAKVTWATFSHDGALAVTASADSTARLWDAQAGRPSHVLRHDGVVTSAVFSPDDRSVLTGSADLTARLWDVQSGAQRAVLGGHDGGVTATFSPDGRLVVTASTDGTARIWERSTGRLLGSPIIQRTGVREAVISPDGQRIVTVGSCEARERTQVCDNVARLWLVDGRTPLGEMRGHTGRLNNATFSQDGAVVVTASEDRTARVWEANTGRKLLDLIGHTEAVTSAVLSADGKLIVTASEDETARIFACEVCVSADELVALAGRRLTRRLTGQERTQYGLLSEDGTTFFGRAIRAVVPVSWGTPGG